MVCIYLSKSNFVDALNMWKYPGCICDAMKYAMESTRWWNNDYTAFSVSQTNISKHWSMLSISQKKGGRLNTRLSMMILLNKLTNRFFLSYASRKLTYYVPWLCLHILSVYAISEQGACIKKPVKNRRTYFYFSIFLFFECK